MASGDWFRPAVIELIDTYKRNENLYNPKHTLYYNKQARKKSLENILQAVQKSRKCTTVQDVHKKIQSLRTQFGQEVQKIEKSKSLGDDSLIYTPRVWWFPRFDFIGKYMKMRSDPTTPLSVKIEHNSTANKDPEEGETHFYVEQVVNERAAGNGIDFDDDEEMEVAAEEEGALSAAKKRRLQYPVSIKEHTDDETRTIEYIINDDINASTTESQYVAGSSDLKRHKRRSKAFGKYAGTLMRELSDDQIFCETQNQILKVIEKAALKMSQRKSAV